MDAVSEKKRLRKKIRFEERALCREYKAQADRLIGFRVMGLPEYKDARTVFAFAGLPREINTLPWIAEMLKEGKRVCVPLVKGEGIMELKLIRSLDELRLGTWGIPEPSEGAESVSPGEVDLAVIPCVSCTRGGKRLGQGGGYYDRFLKDFKGCGALVCREALMSDGIPMEAHDAVIPLVVSEKAVYRNE